MVPFRRRDSQPEDATARGEPSTGSRGRDDAGGPSEDLKTMKPATEHILLPLAVSSAKKISPVDEQTDFRKADRLFVAVFKERSEEALHWLGVQGWTEDG